MGILGIYNHENFALLNIVDVEDEEIRSVKVHEIMHMLLSLQTRWGMIEYCFNHIGRLIDSCYMDIAKILHKNCLAVQESLAIFWEKLYIFRKHGEKEFFKSIQEERWKNPNEYNYLKVFLDIINIKGDIDIDDIAFCLYRIAVNSMNIEILDISIENWGNIEQILENHNVPNKAYTNMLNNFVDVLQKENVNLSEYINSIENEWSSADSKKRQNQVDDILKYIEGVCKHSKYYKEILDYLLTIKCKEIDIDSLEDYVIPNSFTIYEFYNGFHQIVNDSTILFIMGNASDIHYTFKNMYLKEETKVIFDVIGDEIAISYFDYIQKKSFGNLVSMLRLKEEIKRYCCPKVISYKAYENNEVLVSMLEECNKHRYFVYCDRPYWSARETIELNCNDKKWMVVDFKKFEVICLEIGEYGIFFIPVCSTEGFFEDLDNYYTGEKIVVNEMFEKTEDLDELNLIINCLFFT